MAFLCSCFSKNVDSESRVTWELECGTFISTPVTLLILDFDNADKVVCTNKLSGDYISLQSVSAKSGLKPTIFLFSLHR